MSRKRKSCGPRWAGRLGCCKDSVIEEPVVWGSSLWTDTGLRMLGEWQWLSREYTRSSNGR